MVEVILLHAVLCNGKIHGYTQEKFRNGKKGVMKNHGCMMSYQEDFLYSLSSCKARIAHHKPINKDEDQ